MVLILEDDKSYTYKEVYGIVDRVLRFVNNQIDGEFSLKYLRKGNWLLNFDNEKFVIRKAKEESKEQLKKTADYIQQLTGNRPTWG
jgi:hypothetical protein